MQKWTFDPGIELSGVMIQMMVDAFKLFPSIALKKLVSYGIGTMKGKDFALDREGWYPIESWLSVFDDFANTVGQRALFQIGQQVHKHAAVPPGINDAHTAIRLLDVIYHLNHRKNGRIMFDQATGTLMQGIGTYGYSGDPNDKKIVAVVEVPYPCDFDRGVLLGFTSRFEKTGRVTHDDRAPCRNRGARSCTYTITW